MAPQLQIAMIYVLGQSLKHFLMMKTISIFLTPMLQWVSQCGKAQLKNLWQTPLPILHLIHSNTFIPGLFLDLSV